ncbi:g12067 [Coccomyxa viridis]|uniref:G12067 protein n=1 Tax=Coccomyxa viridis TaxID=1274662 RepID=A0ABP1GC30_9CHLO
MSTTGYTSLRRCNRIRAAVPVQASGGDGGSGGPRAFPPTAEEEDGQGPFRRLCPLCLGLLYACSRVAPAGALFKKKKKQPETLDDFSGRIVKLYWPIMANLGFSGGIGLACGLALRAVGQALAVALGILFIIIQAGAYMGFVEVKWNNVHKEVIRRFDVNRSGTFDASDFKSILASGLAVLSQGVPSIGGFLTGFALGVK